MKNVGDDNGNGDSGGGRRDVEVEAAASGAGGGPGRRRRRRRGTGGGRGGGGGWPRIVRRRFIVSSISACSSVSRPRSLASSQLAYEGSNAYSDVDANAGVCTNRIRQLQELGGLTFSFPACSVPVGWVLSSLRAASTRVSDFFLCFFYQCSLGILMHMFASNACMIV